MRSLISYVSFFLLLAAFILADDQGEPSEHFKGIIDVTAANAKEYLNGEKYVLAEFYAPWCGHCKHLAPEMKKLGEALEKAKLSNFVAVKVNCDAEKDVCGKFGIRGYPTLKWLPIGVSMDDSSKAEDYSKGRNVEDLVDFIKEKVPSSYALKIEKPMTYVKVLDTQNFDDVVFSGKKVLVKFYAPWCGHCKRMAPDYEAVAKLFEGSEEVIVAELDADKYRSIGEKHDIKGFPTLKSWKTTDKSVAGTDYSGARSIEAMVEFLNEGIEMKRDAATGNLKDSVGAIPEINKIVKGFASLKDEAKMNEIIEKVKEVKVEGKFQEDNKNCYLRTLKSIVEKGSDYASKESSRLDRVMKSGSIAKKRVDDMKIKQNILKAF